MERLIRIGAMQSTRKNAHRTNYKIRRRTGALELGYARTTEENTFLKREFSCFAIIPNSFHPKLQRPLLLKTAKTGISHHNLSHCMSTKTTGEDFAEPTDDSGPMETTPGAKPVDLCSDLATLRQTTMEFLDEKQSPPGSMNLESFEEACRILWAWTEVDSLESVQKSIALLERLVTEQNNNFGPGLSELQMNQLLNYSILNAVVKNWYRCWKEEKESMISPKELLSKIEDWSERSPNLGPQTSTISTIMRAVVFDIKALEDAEFVESLLVKMVDEVHEGNPRLKPSIVEYNVVMNGMAKLKQPERAEAILMQLVENYENDFSKLQPDAVSFGTVLYAWKHAKTPDAGERAESVLDLMIKFGLRVRDSSIAKPNLSCYYAVLYALCGNRTKQSIEQAERFLQRMKQDYESGNIEARPNATCYALIIHSWSQLGHGEQSERMLRQMYDDFTQHGNSEAQVTSLHVNSAITAWARSRAPYALDRAWKLFESMENIGVKPDNATYGAMLHCMSRSNNPRVGEAADRLLQEQHARFCAGDQSNKPDVLNYNAAMHCWSSVGNAERTENLLEELIGEHKQGNLQISDDRPFCTALAAWSRSRSPQKAERAEAIFQEMNRLVEHGDFDFKPGAGSYSALQGCWASAQLNISGEKCLALLRGMQKRADAGDLSMQPTEANYKVVIDAFNRIRRPQQAENLLHEMLQDHVEGKIDVKPGADICKAILTGWLQSGAPNAVEKTVAIIERLAEIERSRILELNLDMNAYYLMLDVCSKAGARETIAEAETLVRKLEEVHEGGTTFPRPDTRCYNIAINCWGKVGHAERAEALFWEMYSGTASAKPDSFTISTVLSAWSRSESDSAPRRAEVFFERVNKLISSGALVGAELDVVCYSALLNCLANAGTEEAAERAELIFRSMQNSAAAGQEELQPNAKCYFSVIKCLTDVGKLERAEEVLFEMADLCVKKGRNDLQLHPKRSFGLIMAAWLQSSLDDAPVRAEKLLRWMIEQHHRGVAQGLPDALTFASVLRCWAGSRRPESGKRVESLLLEMTKLFGPDHKWVQACHSDLICALARSGSVHRAETLLTRMCQDFLKQDNKRMHKTNSAVAPKPETRAFVALFAGLKKKTASFGNTQSPSNDTPWRILQLIELLREIETRHKPPTSSRVNVVLDHWNALATVGSSSQKGLQVFLSQMEDLDARTEHQRGRNRMGNNDIDDDFDSGDDDEDKDERGGAAATANPVSVALKF